MLKLPSNTTFIWHNTGILARDIRWERIFRFNKWIEFFSASVFPFSRIPPTRRRRPTSLPPFHHPLHILIYIALVLFAWDFGCCWEEHRHQWHWFKAHRISNYACYDSWLHQLFVARNKCEWLLNVSIDNVHIFKFTTKIKASVMLCLAFLGVSPVSIVLFFFFFFIIQLIQFWAHINISIPQNFYYATVSID